MPKPFRTIEPEAAGQPEGSAAPVAAPQTETVARRRRFSPAEKLRIVRLADACRKPGELEALLRREGIYSSSLSQWRKAFRQAGEKALAGAKTGRPVKYDAKDRRIMELERRNARLEREAEINRLLLELQKKASELLGVTLPTLPTGEKP